MAAMLTLRDLNVRIHKSRGSLHAVRGVDLTVSKGTVHCLVGESGCGKSLTLLSILGLHGANIYTSAQCAELAGSPLDINDRRQLEGLRGNRIGMIFQDPMTAFNPTLTIGEQLVEIHRKHKKQGRDVARARAIALLEKVGISSAQSRLGQYPHELSGGLRQRAMIAMALMCEPDLLLADEPTTALDVTVQSQVLHLLKTLKDELGLSIVLVTHDLGVVAAIADEVTVMYAGKVVETGTVAELFEHARHPYTAALFQCIPTLDDLETGRRLQTIPGRVPVLDRVLEGCAFFERCTVNTDACKVGEIELLATSATGRTRCLHYKPSA
jgi:peptide/nickel transport system ATP-binding protein